MKKLGVNTNALANECVRKQNPRTSTKCVVIFIETCYYFSGAFFVDV